MINRRKFLQISLGAAVVSTIPFSCKSGAKVKGRIVGSSAHVGHMLRDGKFGTPGIITRKKIVIVGAGISGLTAGYFLQKHNEQDFIILDLEKEAGGNSRWDANGISAFPWGAHYIPTPNNDLTEYLDFLKDANVITGNDSAGLPVYNEYYLCFDPQERLYINGRWQNGIVPNYGLPETELHQIERFLEKMETFRNKKGRDNKYAFSIPIDRSSTDEEFIKLDGITMKDWLNQSGFSSPALHWYVNYCTRDDFGTNYDEASAWIGIHYFASRKGRGANAGHNDVLTWPEGNGFLVKELSKNIGSHIKTGCLAVEIKKTGDKVLINYFDTGENKLKALEADHCIVAVPQFVAARLLKDERRKNMVSQYFQYTPWMVANLTVDELKERSGAPLSWDNVIYNSDSLGYVVATHELLQQKTPKKNFTYYLPLTHLPPKQAREQAQERTYSEWFSMVVKDLKKIHPDIENHTSEFNVLLWGHAMVKPVPGIIHSSIRKELADPEGNIHFAHTDLAGASIFEEAFYQGFNAFKKISKK